MNDELKEILDNTLEYLKGNDETRNTKILTTNETNILLDYITNLQQENERLKEELNGKQLREIHKVNNYDYFKEMTDNWNREDFSRRCYDLCNEKVDLQQRIEKAVEYIKKHIEKCNIDGYEGKFDNFDIFTKPQKLIDILNGEDNE